jgi:hypothetical protein
VLPGRPQEADNGPVVMRLAAIAGSQTAASRAQPQSGFPIQIKYLAAQVIPRQKAVGKSNAGDLALRTANLKNALLEWGVIEAVLIDMISSREAFFRSVGRNGTIVFGTARPGQLVSASGLIDRDAPPSELSAVQLQRALEAAKNAAWTQHERDFIESFRTKDQRIVVLDERRPGAENEVRALRRGEMVRAHTPGFSQDKQVAIVRVYLAMGLHVGHATYVLTRQDRNWVVLARVVMVRY